MLVRIGENVVSVRGSLAGGQAVIKGSLGRVEQPRRRGRQPSEAEQRRRARWARWIRQWSQMTEDQRDEWRDRRAQIVADNGGSSEGIPSPRDLWVQWASARSDAGIDPFPPPSIVSGGNPGPLVVVPRPDAPEGMLRLVLRSQFVDFGLSDPICNVYLTAPIRGSRYRWRSGWRFLTSFKLDEPQPGIDGPPIDIAPPWPIPPSSTYWIGVTIHDDNGFATERLRWPILTPPEGWKTTALLTNGGADLWQVGILPEPFPRLVTRREVGGNTVFFNVFLTDPQFDTLGELFSDGQSEGGFVTWWSDLQDSDRLSVDLHFKPKRGGPQTVQPEPLWIPAAP